jgi:hypothetical protein
MVSRVAQRRFMILAVCSLALGILGALITYHPKLFEPSQPIPLKVVELIVLFPSIIGGLCMFFGMAWYCLELDTAGAPARVLLAFLMLCTVPFGQVIYYFVVYRRQTARVAMRII